MKSVFIHSATSISAQETFEKKGLDMEAVALSFKEENLVKAVKPNYKEYFSPVMSRRMATGVKMGVAAAKQAIGNAGLDTVEAIVTGTGLGCVEDSEKFLNAVIDNDEQYLTPTSFIQSTHNTVGAQIALNLKNKAYNVTYVSGANSFESALFDGQLLLKEHKENVLVGGVDELGKKLINEYKKKYEQRVSFSEGANFFVIGKEKKDQSLAKLVDVETFEKIELSKLESKVLSFLKNNALEITDVDAIVLGVNGDDFDTYYQPLKENLFESKTQIQYKNLSGEFYTASAFGFYTATQLLSKQELPNNCFINSIKQEKYKTVLLYNQYLGKQHSLVLLQSC